MSVVTRTAGPMQIADALNRFSSKFGTGAVQLGAGTSTIVQDPRISPASVVLFVPGAGGGAFGGSGGDGGVELVHPSNSEGQIYRYVVVNV